MDEEKVNKCYEKLKALHDSRGYWRKRLDIEVTNGRISPGARKERLETDLQSSVSVIVFDALLPTKGDQRELRDKLLRKIREHIAKEAQTVTS